ncbi:MAG TPA: hypothetical protein VEY07_07600, partial [Thermoplasmata archaeon]|nr:hypothetical protein [Thermoplasmata archaeon]
ASASVTTLALPLPREAPLLRGRLTDGPAGGRGSKPPIRPRQINTNAWAKRRIAEQSAALGLPEPVKRQALELYDRIVAYHTARTPPPPGSGGQLSPRLNWSLVFTTIYLACRLEEYPKELREILGRNQRPGTIKEMYRLYRYYKRQLHLTINLVDVKTFIHSWIDGFEMSEVMVDAVASGDAAWLLKRAIAIGDRARSEAALRRTSTRLIAAGALTTALVERTPPSRLTAFYKAIARFLHMSEETIRFVVAQIASIL